MIFPGSSRPRSQWGFRWSVAWLVREVPVAGGRSPSLAPLPLGRPTRTSQRNPQPGPSRGRTPSLALGRPTRASQRTCQAGSLAKERSGPSNQSPTRPSGRRETRAWFANLPDRGEHLLGDNPRGSQNFPPNSCDQEFQTGRAPSQDLEIFSNRARFSNPGRPGARGSLSQGAVRLAGWQVEASLDGGPRDPGRQAPWTPGGSGCVPLPWGPTTRPPSGRSGAK